MPLSFAKVSVGMVGDFVSDYGDSGQMAFSYNVVSSTLGVSKSMYTSVLGVARATSATFNIS